MCPLRVVAPFECVGKEIYYLKRTCGPNKDKYNHVFNHLFEEYKALTDASLFCMAKTTVFLHPVSTATKCSEPVFTLTIILV